MTAFAPNDPAAALFAAATQTLEADGHAIGKNAGQPASVAGARRRRAGAGADPEGSAYLTLVRDEAGLLDWRVDAGPAPHPRQQALRRGRIGVFHETPVDQTMFKLVQGSQVSQLLRKLDKGFNDRYGLYNLAGHPVGQAAVQQGRVLLLVHGTFSKCDAILEQLNDFKVGDGTPGIDLLNSASATYDQVLLFEHPTLQVAPWINALDLARAFAGTEAQIDVICHSRGGLVTRWWLEVLQRELIPRTRVVFIGSPLMGTGLASPYRLRQALKLFANYAEAISQVSHLASLAVPIFTVAQGLATLVGSASNILASTPVADAVVAAVPGLAGMSRFGPDANDFIEGNAELEKLSFNCPSPPSASYFAVSSNFESEEIGWRFWKTFRNPLMRIADATTDALFSGENDLVVDTASMGDFGLAVGPVSSTAITMTNADQRLDFGTNSVVHHLNYFSQPRTVAFIRSKLVF